MDFPARRRTRSARRRPRAAPTWRWAATLTLVALVAAGCRRGAVAPEESQAGAASSSAAPAGPTAPDEPTPRDDSPEEAMAAATQAELRERMVRSQIAARGIRAPAVLDAMRAVPRHRFVPEELLDRAYDDTPLPIGHAQTISQPYIVALMTELVRPAPGKRALDVGTGSGYQAAVLAEIVDHVDSIDIVCPLADQARERLADLGYRNVTIRCGDGWAGWPGGGAYDVIVVAAAPREIPPPLLAQLAPGGRLVIPLGVGDQDLVLVEKKPDGELEETYITAVRFVPMTGRARDGEPGGD